MEKFKRFNYWGRTGQGSGARRSPYRPNRYLLTRASKSVSFC